MRADVLLPRAGSKIPETAGRAMPRARRGLLPGLCVCLLSLAGCSSAYQPPVNANAALYDPEKSTVPDRHEMLSFSSTSCPPAGTSDFIMPQLQPDHEHTSLGHLTMRYSPGDRFNIFVFGSPEFSGDYAVNADGTVALPFAKPIEVLGLTNTELSEEIAAALVGAGLFSQEALKLSVRPVQYAPINVTVAGAVFITGRHSINSIKDADKLDRALNKFGDSPQDRFVAAALRAAGGVRPDADLSNVKVIRRGRMFVLDWRGAITGAPVDDIPLIEGDHIDIGESGCFQSALVRPSQITLGGIKIFTSNLTVPALNNSSSTVGGPQGGGGSVPYGTRFLQALVQANCVGGTFSTNASRYGILISRNPKTRETEVVQRSIEELVRSPLRDMINPYLMPDDAIACYDSTVTEVRDVLSTLQSIFNPALSVRTLLTPITAGK